MSRIRMLFALALAGCCPAAATAPTTTTMVKPSPAPDVIQPTTIVKEEKLDGGTLAIAIGGAPAGTEGFELRKAGDELVLETHIDANVMGQKIRGMSTVQLDGRGRPMRALVRMSVDGMAVINSLDHGPDAAVLTSKVGEAAAKDERATGPIDIYLDNTSFAHFVPACRMNAETLTAFPGIVIERGAVREAGGVRAIPLDLAGSLALVIYCDGERYLGLDAPLLSLTVTRDGEAARVAALRQKPREKPALPDGLVELDRSVDVPAAPGIEPAKLACSLMLPASHKDVTKRAKKGPTRALPGVIFITGSGTQDRDEDSYGPGGLKMSIFKTIAIELGKAGIASLRCDDRASGGSTGSVENVTLQTFAADAAATLDALRREPAVNPMKTGMIGHSEGGIIAPLVALSIVPTPRALVLMAGTGRPFDVIIDEQALHVMQQAGTSKDEIDKEMAKRKSVYEALRAGKPLPSTLDPQEAKEWTKNQSWIVSHLKHDPAGTAAKVKGVAVLIAQGSLDKQVSVADADALEVALKKKNKVVQKIVYPGLNHLFAMAKTGDISEYSDPEAKVDATFLADVVRFLTANL